MEEKFKSIIKMNGLSLTKQRMELFSMLATVTGAITMNELLRLCPQIDRVTVYRIVEQFEKIGIIQKIQIGWKYKIEIGDIFKAHHHHLSCLSCGSSIDFDEPEELDSLLERIGRKHAFAITQHTLELRGVCSRCKLKP